MTAGGIEAGEFQALADRRGIHPVPAVVVNSLARWTGNGPEHVVVDRLLTAVAA